MSKTRSLRDALMLDLADISTGNGFNTDVNTTSREPLHWNESIKPALCVMDSEGGTSDAVPAPHAPLPASGIAAHAPSDTTQAGRLAEAEANLSGADSERERFYALATAAKLSFEVQMNEKAEIEKKLRLQEYEKEIQLL